MVYYKSEKMSEESDDSYKHEQMEKEAAQRYVKLYDRLKAKRSTWESYWQECLKYVVPRKENITSTVVPGSRHGEELYDTTAIAANQLLAGALHGMLTNPAVKFFEIIPSDTALLNNLDVKRWAAQVSDAMFAVMNQSNFQTEVHEVYLDLGSIGTSCMFIDEDDENVVRFSTRSMAEIFVQENNKGFIDTVVRKFQFTPKQMVDEWGYDEMPREVQDMYDRHIDEKFTIIHVVKPVSDKDKEEEPKLKLFEYESRYVLVDKCCLLHTGGYKEFPYAVPRWTKISGEEYGRGPTQDMLADIKMVNQMMQTVIAGAQLTVWPALMVSDDCVIGNVRLVPGGVVMVRPSTEVPIRPITTDARIDFGYQAVEDVRKRIRAGYFVDQLQLNEGPQMTATEVMQRTEEKLRLMGPVLGRQHYEFLRPVVERVFAIMARKKLIPMPPREMQGKKFDVRYSSLIAKTQRLNEGANISRAIGALAPVLQAKPQSLDIIDGDWTVRYVLNDVFGLPTDICKTPAAVDKQRKAVAEAQAAQMQQQQQMQQADMAAKFAPAAVQMSAAKQ